MHINYLNNPTVKPREENNSFFTNLIIPCSECKNGYYYFNLNHPWDNAWIEEKGNEGSPGLTVIPIICNKCNYSSLIHINILIPINIEDV